MFTADNHLRRCAWTGRPSLVGDAYVGFAQVIDHCVAHGLNLVLGGDVLDATSPSSESIRFLQQQVERMTAAGLSVFAVDGNHDRVEVGGVLPRHLQQLAGVADVSPSWATVVPGVQYVDQTIFEPVPGLAARGLTYRASGPLQQALAQVPPEVRVLVGHQMADWAMPIEGRFNLRAEWVPCGKCRHALYIEQCTLGGSGASQRATRPMPESGCHLRITRRCAEP